MRIEEIIKEVFEIYKECGIKSFPIDCSHILNYYGFKVFPYSKLQKEQPEIFELGYSYSSDSLKWKNIIAYNDKQSWERTRFSLMHELGHDVLNIPGGTPENEAIADRFAGIILAPPQIIVTSGCKTADAIHDMFGLSFAAANRALYNTNYWLATTKRTELDFQIRDWFNPPNPPQFELKKKKSKVVEAPPKKPEPGATSPPSKEFEERRAKVLAKLRRQRRKIQKQLKQYEEDIKFLGISDSDSFDRAEQQWLYGNNL